MVSKLSLLSDEDVLRIAAFDITDTLDLHDPRFGSTGSLSFECVTCKMQEDQCIGHHASLSLKCSIIHPLIYKEAEKIINNTCRYCGARLVNIVKYKKTDCPSCNKQNFTDYKIKVGQKASTRRQHRKSTSPEGSINEEIPHAAVRAGKTQDYLYPKDVQRILPRGYVISMILIPPIHLRTPEDVEWASSIQKLYEQLTNTIRMHPGDVIAVSLIYAKIVGNEGIFGLLPGKDGIFRKIMLGKRVESCARAVITPDPCISIDEIAVPKMVADVIKVDEIINQYNIKYMKALAAEGKLWWKDDTDSCNAHPRQVIRGMTFCRNLANGDVVLFNRQPSLSRESLMCFRVRIRTDNYKTFGMNPQVVSPFNADFDGDEMNLFVLSHTAELLELCHVSKNINVDGKTTIVPVQDVVTGCYMMSIRDNPISVDVWNNCLMNCYSYIRLLETNNEQSEVKGLQLDNLEEWPMLPIHPSTPALPTNERSEKDTQMTTHALLRMLIPDYDGTIITKKVLTNMIGSMANQQALNMLEALQNVIELWISAEGLTVPMSSVIANQEPYTGDPDEFRERCHARVESELGDTQLMSMIRSGAKGSIIHASHMAVALGQQYINGKPGVLCRNSYYRGLTPTEFFGHQMAAREGVVSTSISTASTGYLNRRACKIMADVKLQYNNTIGDQWYTSTFSPINN